ncbi:MAG: hypothetical protein A2X49_07490 [Lentisphaerae bacterium GWF2_52_8]|nr:MAG: hypothetical protein A2X49_07490 [Lentisphaerae bacterium GWF2_52_8]
MSQEISSAEAQHRIINVASSSNAATHTQHPEAQWFAKAALGLFIHWGIPSVCGECDLSWSMRKSSPGIRKLVAERHGLQGPGITVTPEEYWDFAKKFKPQEFQPEKMLAAAKDAGFTYAVLTTKHHDGFALWPSGHGDFSTKNFMGGRDLVGEYVEACRKTGMKAGLYFSPPDWFFNKEYSDFGCVDGEFYDTAHKKFKPRTPSEEETAAYCEFTGKQIEELLTRYGKIDLLWFDGEIPDRAPISLERIRELQPSIVLNNRIGFGDYITPEGVFPKERPGGWWEECHCWNEGGWGYRSHEIYKPSGFVSMELAKVRGWAGNFLLNVAPDGQGRLPDVCYRRFEELARWMKTCGEAYYDVGIGPWPEQANVPITSKADGTWYIHIDFLSEGQVSINGLERKPKSLRNLRTGENINYSFKDSTLKFELDAGKISLMGEIIVMN